VHTDPDNHAFYFLQGTGELQIGEERWSLQPGTIVKIPAGKVHGFSKHRVGRPRFPRHLRSAELVGAELKRPPASAASVSLSR
jgi:hypothetical protein